MAESPRFQIPQFASPLHGGRIAAMVELAELAGDTTLQYFRNADLQWERKSDDSPVTVADKSAEQAVRERIAQMFPDDIIEGEEFGRDESEVDRAGYRWIIDPIDGTKSFLCGVPLYSTLIGITLDHSPIAGTIYLPALGELIFAAQGQGSWYAAIGAEREASPFTRAHVSGTEKIEDSVFVLSQVDSFEKYATEESYKSLQEKSYITRTWGDGYGYLMVATGRAEIMVDPIVSPWDVAAVMPVIVESGGKCTCWSGTANIRAGNMYATNGLLHETVGFYLNREGKPQL